MSGWNAPDKPTHLKKCSEFHDPNCGQPITDGCCPVIPCSYCLRWEVYGEDDVFGVATLSGSEWTGTIAGATFRGFWDRNSYGECEFVVTLDGVYSPPIPPTTITLTSGDDQSGNPSNTDHTYVVTEDGDVVFDWSYVTLDECSTYDPFGILIDGTFYQLTVDGCAPESLTQGGTGVSVFTETGVSLVAGQVFGWRQRTENNLGGSATTVITLDDGVAGGVIDGEVYRKSCSEGQSCRDSSDSVETTIGYDDGTLHWDKRLHRPLEYVVDYETQCRVKFCGDCNCSCECLCVQITDEYTGEVIASGEICDTAYPCDGPVWEGLLAGTRDGYPVDFDLSLALADCDGACCIVVSEGGYEVGTMGVTGCTNLTGTMLLDADTRLTVACKVCSCGNGPLPCCPDFPAPDTLECDVILNAGDCSCFALVGGSYTVTLQLVVEQPGYLEYHGIRRRPTDCNAGSTESVNVYDGFIFICRSDALEGAELHVFQETSPIADPQPSIPIAISADDLWVEDMAAQTQSTEDCAFPLFIFEYGEFHALDACEAEPTSDVTIIVHA